MRWPELAAVDFRAADDDESPTGSEPESSSHAGDLQEACRKLRAASDAKNEFLCRMSHELQTPLTAILGFTQLLSASDLDERQQRWVGTLARATEHVLVLVDEALDLACVESGHVSISQGPLALQPLLEETVELMRPIAENREVTIHVPEARFDGYVLADRNRLAQALINLISNAIKYNHPGGRVRVAAHQSADDRVRISVEDTGTGIDDESLTRLFVPFERLAADAAGVHGTGLGLALTRRFIEAMGGSISVASTPRVGSVFSVELKRVEPSTELRVPIRSLPELPAAASATGSGSPHPLGAPADRTLGSAIALEHRLLHGGGGHRSRQETAHRGRAFTRAAGRHRAPPASVSRPTSIALRPALGRLVAARAARTHRVQAA
jgi:hypothetical protein